MKVAFKNRQSISALNLMFNPARYFRMNLPESTLKRMKTMNIDQKFEVHLESMKSNKKGFRDINPGVSIFQTALNISLCQIFLVSN